MKVTCSSEIFKIKYHNGSYLLSSGIKKLKSFEISYEQLFFL